VQLPVDAPPAAVMTAAIELWRELRHPRLAELVDRIEEELLAAAPRPALRASKARADLEAWQALEAAGDPLDFRRLAAAARGGSQLDVLRQVKALAARSDPRLARALLQLLERPPYAGVKSRPLLAEILAELAATRDRRAAVPAAELAARYLGVVLSGTGRWMVAQLDATARRLADAPHGELPGELAAQVAALEARYGVRAEAPAAARRRTLDELLAEVYAAPDDDGPRLVYADTLLERGDLRGELIALQIARARGPVTDEARAREAELLADPARLAAWAQPLSTGGTCTFERGFPAHLRLSRPRKDLLDVPAWATITGVSNLTQTSQAMATRICELPGLRSVATLRAPLLEKLCATPRRWTHVGIDDLRPPPAQVFAALPELRSLELRVHEPLPRDYLAGLALRELTLQARGAWAALDLPPDLERLHITVPHELPTMALASLARLAWLRLDYGRERGALALPASLQHLELFAQRAALSPIQIAQPSQLRSAQLRVHELAPAALRALSSLEALDLLVVQGVPAGALEPLPRLRKLSLYAGSAPLRPDALAHLVHLEELEVSARGPMEVQLDGLPLRSLAWKDVPLDQFPAGLPLERARVTLPEALDELERFVRRYPALSRLDLEVGYAVSLDYGSAVHWRRFVEILAQSPIQSCTFRHRHETIELARDDAGAISRLRVTHSDSPLTEAFAHAVPQLSALASPTKLPAKLARLVRQHEREPAQT